MNKILIIITIFICSCRQSSPNSSEYNETDIRCILQKSKGDSLIRINSTNDSIPVYKYFYYDKSSCCGSIETIIISGNSSTVNYRSGKITYNILENFGADLPSIASDTTIDSIFIYKNGNQILYRKNK